MTDEVKPDATPTPSAFSEADFLALKDSVSKLEAKNQELISEKAKAKREAEQAALDAAKKGGDVEALEKSWQEKLSSRETELTTQLQTYQQMIQQVTSGAAATELAARLALDECSPALLPHIQARLTTEIKDGKPTLRVLDKDGKPSAMTVADLEAELKATPYLKPLIRGSAASGGFPPGGAGGAQTSLMSLTADQRAHLKATNPTEYQRLVDDYMKK